MKSPQALAFCILAFSFSIPHSPFSILSAHAADSTFTTSLTTTGVISIPTVPANLVAVPVSDVQIDLSWSASTESLYGIAGYRLFRDGDFLATTTALSYADTGLTASTTYSYAVEAFDTNLDFSGQSATVSTTTLPTPPSPTPPPPSPAAPTISSSGSTVLKIYDIKVDPDLHQAVVSFSTNAPAQPEIFWGKTADYEIGSLMSPPYGYAHQLLINGLESGTAYLLKITAVNNQGVTASEEVSFKTLSPFIQGPLANPSDFKAAPFSDHIRLSWKNPNDPRFTQVRIVRSEIFFPRDQFDGEPIYEGAASAFDDRNVILGKTYYYAIFSESADGLFSSGALAEARVPLPGERPTPTAFDPFANLPASRNVDPRLAALTLSDFDFIQTGKRLAMINGRTVAIDGSEDLTVRLAYGKVPEVLKTVALTLQDPEDPTAVFPFLLRVNADKTYYEATIGPLGHSGDYALSLAILDFQNMGLKRLNGDLRALVFQAPIWNRNFDPLAFALMLGLTLFLLIVLAARRRGSEPRPVQTVQSVINAP